MNQTEVAKQKTRTILVVDDVASNRKLLRRLLEKEGYHIVDVPGGGECLEYCSQNRLPDLILLDVMMPEVDGFEVCRQLREKHLPHELPIILLTGKTDGKDQQVGLDLGANEYVVKPFERLSLLARIRNQLLLVDTFVQMEQQRRIAQRSLNIQSALGDSLPEALLVQDFLGTLVYSNNHLMSLAGGTSYHELPEVLRHIFDGEYAAELLETHHELQLVPTLQVEREFNHPGGRYTNIYVLSRPISLENENLRLWVFRDLSHIRQLEQRIKQQVKLDTVGLFATGVAHNFNNILGPILGAAERLAKPSVKPSIQERCMRIIRRGVQTGRILTRNLSRIGVDADEANTAPIDVGEVVRLICIIQGELAGPTYQWELNISGSAILDCISMVGLGDVLTQLTANAVDSMPEGGLVTLEMEVDRRSGTVRISVGDKGCGISPEQREHIFDPFYSTKNLDTVNGMSMVGDGLGLWSVYNRVKKAGGDILVDSVVGFGTTMTIVLPLPFEE